MRMKILWRKLRSQNTTRPVATDWTTGWSMRDLADLPTYHPRRDDR
jgi:hypothetical protein